MIWMTLTLYILNIDTILPVGECKRLYFRIYTFELSDKDALPNHWKQRIHFVSWKLIQFVFMTSSDYVNSQLNGIINFKQKQTFQYLMKKMHIREHSGNSSIFHYVYVYT